jgi:hypothetical protein
MPAARYERNLTTEQIRITGDSITELAEAVGHFLSKAEEGARWFVDEDTIVLEHPMGESLVGGEKFPKP